MKKTLLAVIISCCCNIVSSQVLPKEASQLHYRLIGFSLPTGEISGDSKIEIAQGDYYSVDSFTNNIIISKKLSGNRVIAEVPLYSQHYTWRILSANNPLRKNTLFHFSTYIPDSNRMNNRLRVVNPATRFKDAFVFLDETRTLYDMNGNPVWHLPLMKDFGADKTPVRDMKITAQGTITFLVEGNEALEINYDGALLWKGPNTGEVSKTDKENYHHEFTRLKNGHYMVLGSAPLTRQPGSVPLDSMRMMKQSVDSTQVHPNRKRNAGIPFGTIIEYDKSGKVVWYWKSSEYFLKSDIRHYVDENGRRMNDVHLNSFYFDEVTQVIYASFKNISRILKIKYPEGTVLNAYGEIYKPGIRAAGNNLFCYQHACKLTTNGQLYLFNNNSCYPDCSPEIIVAKEPLDENEKLTATWTYECPVAPLSTIHSGNFQPNGMGTTGGNVIELPDGHFFGSLCSPYGLLFIVNKNKQIIWSAQAERWNPSESRYTDYPQYRASIILGQEYMEKLIWNSQQDSHTDQ